VCSSAMSAALQQAIITTAAVLMTFGRLVTDRSR
jgi:hypothetical protein